MSAMPEASASRRCIQGQQGTSALPGSGSATISHVIRPTSEPVAVPRPGQSQLVLDQRGHGMRREVTPGGRSPLALRNIRRQRARGACRGRATARWLVVERQTPTATNSANGSANAPP